MIGTVYASLYANRLSAALPSRLPNALARVAHDSVGAALAVSSRLDHAGFAAVGATVHWTASASFFHGHSAGALIAASIVAAGAVLAAVRCRHKRSLSSKRARRSWSRCCSMTLLMDISLT